MILDGETENALTVGLLVAGPGAGSAELLGLAAPGVGDEQRPVELDEHVLDGLLALFVDVCKQEDNCMNGVIKMRGYKQSGAAG